MEKQRTAHIERKTKETQIDLALNLDGQANYEIMINSKLKNIIYLLRAKCDVVARDIGVKEGTPVIIV